MLTRKRPNSRRRTWIYALSFFGIFAFYQLSHSDDLADEPVASGALLVEDGAAPLGMDAAVDAVAADHGDEGHSGGHGNLGPYFLALVLILFLAKLGGDLMERLGQPAVLGELIFGVILGNLALFGLHNEQTIAYLHFLATDSVISTLAEIGVVLLLFQIGLESTVGEMRKVGLSAFLVAVIGVVVPFVLGYGVTFLFLKDVDQMVHVFIGAVLCATSVGITARVLQDIGKLDTKEAKIILGAAVVDDVLGLVVLAVVSGIIKAKGAGEELAMSSILIIVGKAGAFFIGSIVIGVLLSPKLFRLASFLRAKGVLLTLSLTICFLFSWLAGLIDLAPIVGAFCAGLILEEASFRELGDYRRQNLEELIAPIAAFLVPIFFVRMGLQVDLAAFGEEGILLFALVLTVAAIIGKQVCSFGVREKDVDGIAVALGMIPRGEVGLIFANIGLGLVIAGHPVIDGSTYSAIVIMVMVTTLVTPPVLSWRFKRHNGAQPKAE
jgi:Kef-type K+ transport system membrane component KefB